MSADPIRTRLPSPHLGLAVHFVLLGGLAYVLFTRPAAPPAVAPNVVTDFSPASTSPKVDSQAYIHPHAQVIGAVLLGEQVFVAPFASVRGDEGQPIVIGAHSNVQDGVVIHALETEEHGVPLPENTVEKNGKKYAVWIGERVSLAHQAQVHGPALVDDGTFVGMQALVFKATVGKGCVLEPRALVMGVTIPDGRYVPAGAVIRNQEDADALPVIDESYPLRALNEKVVHVNDAFAVGYAGVKAKAH